MTDRLLCLYDYLVHVPAMVVTKHDKACMNQNSWYESASESCTGREHHDSNHQYWWFIDSVTHHFLLGRLEQPPELSEVVRRDGLELALAPPHLLQDLVVLHHVGALAASAVVGVEDALEMLQVIIWNRPRFDQIQINTEWPFRLFKTSCWHWSESCVLVSRP